MAKRIVNRTRRATGMAMGAALMYFYDPQLGAKRRQATKDRVTDWWQGLGRSRRPADTPEVVADVQPVPPLERVVSAS